MAKYNWPQIFTDFEQSGLTQTAFCKQHGINPKYFSLKFSKNKAPSRTGFAKVVVETDPPATTGLILEMGKCRIHCPAAMPIASFVSLVKSLA